MKVPDDPDRESETKKKSWPIHSNATSCGRQKKKKMVMMKKKKKEETRATRWKEGATKEVSDDATVD